MMKLAASVARLTYQGAMMFLNWSNFMRVDDFGNEILVKVKGEEESVEQEYKQCKADLLKILQGTIDSIEAMPSNAMSQPITHYDMLSMLLLMSSLFNAKD